MTVPTPPRAPRASRDDLHPDLPRWEDEAPRALRDRILRPWLDPRPGELRGAVVLLAGALAFTVALWFDATRRPERPTTPAPVVEVVGAGGATAPAAVPPGGGTGGGPGPADPFAPGGALGPAAGPTVHVTGAVSLPGLLSLPPGARVSDAVAAAGGALPDAWLERVNLARPVTVGELWLHPSPDGKAAVDRLVDVARDRGVPVRGPLAGAVLRVGDLTLEVLAPWPALLDATGPGASNDASFVLRDSAGGAAVLLGGDSGAAVHRRLLAAAPDRLRADVLVVPHHGSTTSDLRLFAAVGPSVAVVSAGRDNPYGHPHREIVAELVRLGVPLRRTDEDGTVTVRLPARVPVPAAGAG